MPENKQRSRPSSFFSALIGGLVVAALGWLAIGNGWVTVPDDGDGLPTATVLGQPVVDQAGDGKTVGEIYNVVSPGVAFIRARSQASAGDSLDPFGDQDRGGGGTGSGFVIDTEGRVITNAHVVDGATEIEVVLGEDDKVYDAVVLGSDSSTDIAVLEVEAPEEDLHPIELGESSAVQVGDPVVAVGNPFGLDRTVTSGIVSALQREITAPNGFAIRNVIQTDAPINPGNSGGPLLNAQGRVIGVNSQIASTSGGSVGIGFAVPVDTVSQVMEGLINDGRIDHAFIGIGGADITPQLAEVLNLPVEAGALIQTVHEGGPADEAGLEAGSTQISIDGAPIQVGGDIIVAVDDQPVTSMSEVGAAIDAKNPGDRILLTIIRDGDRETVIVELGSRPGGEDG